MTSENGCCRWHIAIGLLAIGLVACSLPAYAAMNPISGSGQNTPAVVERDTQAADQSADQGKTSTAWMGKKLDYVVDEGLRDTGVCTPPVAGPEPASCTTNSDCVPIGQGDPGYTGVCTAGNCAYPALVACTPETADAVCNQNGNWAKWHSTGHCEGGFCENQAFHYCADPGDTNEGEWHLGLNATSGDPQGCGVLEDNFNGGCNATSGAVFSTITCGETVCGTGTVRAFSGSTLRDTDWYEFVAVAPTRITMYATAEFEMVFGLGRNHGDDNCANYDYYFWGGHYAVVDPCVKGTATACIGPGTWWIAVVPTFEQGQIPCLDYEMYVECDTPCSIGCCIGNDVCTETDEDTCQFGLLGSIAGASCTPGLCVWGCPGDPVTCNVQETVDNSLETDFANPVMSCGTGTQIGVLWYWFEATYDSVLISTCNSLPIEGGDSNFALYSGDCTNTLVEVACSEDEGCTEGGGPWLGEIDFCDLTVGNTYYIQFASWAAVAQGTYKLDVVCPSPTCAPAACCLSDGTCITATPTECDQADPPYGGQYGGAGTACLGDADTNGIDDQCEIGACCEADGTCTPSSESACFFGIGGVDFIPGGRCDLPEGNPCQGACCRFRTLPPPAVWICENKPDAICSTTWYQFEFCGGAGGLPPWFECPDDRICTLHPDADPNNCQEPDASTRGVEGSTGVVSDENNDDDPLGPGASRAADDFKATATGNITQVCWWGHYEDLDTSAGDPDGAGPEPEGACSKATETASFEVTYYTDAGGCPGTVLSKYDQPGTLTNLKRTTAGWRDPNGHLVYEYEATHAARAVTSGTCYWLEIVNDTGVDTCAWVWSPAPMFHDDGSQNGNGYAVLEDGLAGTGGYDCTVNCPTCSTLLRYDLAWCVNVANTWCTICDPTCTGGTAEGEPICSNGYQDAYNVGCNALTTNGEVFTPIALCEKVCGTYGTFEAAIACVDNGDCPVPETCVAGVCTGAWTPHRDTDWYKFTVPTDLGNPVFVEWCVTGEYPTLMGMINTFGQDNCPPNLTWAALGVNPACIGTCEGSSFPQGTIWYGYVATSTISNVRPCGGEYTLTLNHTSCGAAAEGACCVDGVCTVTTEAECTGIYKGDDTVCTPNPCDCTCTAARSAKTHTVGGRIELNMGCSGGIEPRWVGGGVAELEIDLDDATIFGGAAGDVSVSCTAPGWAGTKGVSVAGNTVTLTFTPALPNLTKCNITLDCGASVCVRNIGGDANSSGVTNATDNAARKGLFGQTANAGNAQWDVNQDGTINATDNSQSKGRFGNTAPACP